MKQEKYSSIIPGEYFSVDNKVLKNKHPLRKNNEVVAAMYAMYQTGKSLSQVAKIYHKSRQAVYGVFQSRGYELRTRKFQAIKTIDGKNFYKMKGGYLRCGVGKKRILAHHYIYEKEKGPLPAGYVIRFLDGDLNNLNIENFELVKLEKGMPQIFNPKGLNQFTSPVGSRLKKGERAKIERAKQWERARAFDIASFEAKRELKGKYVL